MADRPPLDVAALDAGLSGQGVWRAVRVVDATPSTNADLVAAAGHTPAGTILVAEHQVAGRGRLDRVWTSPARAGLTFSMLLRPAVAQPRWAWLSLLVGVAVCDVVANWGVDVALKWPNDVLAGPDRRKVAGILAQVAGDAVVVGVGLNVTTTEDELPVDTATSLALSGAAELDRTRLLLALLRAVGRWYTEWTRLQGDPTSSGLADEYRRWCETLGRRVRITATDGSAYEADAVDVDESGRLVVDVGARLVAVAASDVEHVRGQ